MENDDFGIFIDTGGNFEPTTDHEEQAEHDCAGDKIIKQVLKEFWEEKALEKEKKASSSEEQPLTPFERFHNEMGWHGPVPLKQEEELSKKKKRKRPEPPRQDPAGEKKRVAEILKKSKVLQPEFNELHTVPAYDVSERKLKREREKEREKTKGQMWYNLPATEVTEEVKKDLEILKMRSVLDPKHFYKKNDIKVLPKYFQIGTVQDSALDYHDRLTKKERKRTLVDELLSNAEFERYNKKKYAEIVAEKQKTHYGAYRQAKKLKRKKK